MSLNSAVAEIIQSFVSCERYILYDATVEPLVELMIKVCKAVLKTGVTLTSHSIGKRWADLQRDE